MDYEKLEKAKSEAKRFLEAAEEVRIHRGNSPHVWLESHTKENGTCLRASLDLTRALAELRKG